MTTLGRSPTEKLLLDMETLNPRAESTKYQYVLHSKHFLKASSMPPTRDDVLEFIGQKEAQATKQFIFFILRRLFRANEWRWPFSEGEAPQVSDQAKVKIDVPTVTAMIRNWRILEPEECFFLALSTMWGFRRKELSNAADLSFDANTPRLELQAVKHGKLRVHTIPEVIMPHLLASPGPLGVQGVQDVLKSIANKTEQSIPRGGGWHAIRRTLISEIGLRVPSTVIVSFMGWKSGEGPRVLYEYTNPDPADVDKIVFEHHPFLKVWEQAI
jgi:hypothetical protein